MSKDDSTEMGVNDLDKTRDGESPRRRRDVLP